MNPSASEDGDAEAPDPATPKTFSVLDALRESHEKNKSALERIVADAESASDVAEALSRFTTHAEARNGSMMERLLEAANAKVSPPLDKPATEPVRDYDSLLSAVTSRFTLDEVSDVWKREGLDRPSSSFSRLMEETANHTRRMTSDAGYTSAFKQMVNESSAYVSMAERLRQMDQAPTSLIDRVSALYDKPHTMEMLYGRRYESILGSLNAAARNPQVLSGLRSSLYADPATGFYNRVTERVSLSDLTSAAQGMLAGKPMESLDAIYERLVLDDIEDEDGFEEAASRVLSEVEEDDVTAPSEEDLTSREALVQLLIALRPDVSDDPDLHRNLRRYVGGSGLLFYLYLRVFHPQFLMALGMLLEMLGLYALMVTITDHAVAGGKPPQDDQEQD